ncbi:MAG TPA: hypothetical protein DEV72_18535 [Ktedonobacter sp.]|nr:hypothetical protein [Ktedonobacter sp.]
MSSTAKPTKNIEIFFSYSHKDQRFRDQLETHLSLLKREGYVSSWHDRKIGAGEEWAGQIDDHLNTAQIILLLISADFMASEYCYSKELKRAMERHSAGEASVIPVILRHCDWHTAPFGKLQALPTDGKPILSWSIRDDAYLNIVTNIRKAVEELSNNSEVLPQAKSSKDDTPNRTLEQWLDMGQIYFNQWDFERALAAYEQAIRLDPNNAYAYHRKGHSLRRLNRLYEALSAYKQAIRLDPNNFEFYYGKGRVLEAMERYEEAVTAFDLAIRLDPNFSGQYNFKGVTLYHLKRYEEALAAFEQTIVLEPNYPNIYINKGIVLQDLKRYEEALDAFDKAIRTDPTDATAYNGKGLALYSLKRYEEALDAFDLAIHLEPDYATAYKNKGSALEGLGRLEEAKRAYKRALQLES